jgi:hypothetical protein
MSDENTVLKQAILDTLNAVPTSRKFIIHAQQFQEAIEKLGLTFGHPVVDEVMLGCKQDSQGFVDYSRFVEEFQDQQILKVASNAPTSSLAQQQVQQQFAQQQEEAQFNAPPQVNRQRGLNDIEIKYQNALKNEKFGGTPQKEIVRRSNQSIADLFSKFDNGLCSVAAFRQSLLDLGIKETNALARLLRTTPCEFKYKELLNALQMEDGRNFNNAVAGARFDRNDGTIISDKRRTGRSPRRGAQKLGVNYSGIDVVTWRGDTGNEEARPRVNSLTGKAHGEFYKPDNTSSGVRGAMFRDQYQPSSTWSTAAMEQQYNGTGREVVSGMANIGGRVTALRTAVYDGVRQLDAGQITTDQFYARMNAMEIPLPTSMQRLIAKQKAHGSAVFRDFVQAMGPVFAEMERVEAMKNAAAPQSNSNNTQQQVVQQQQQNVGMQSNAAFRNKTKATKSHGDILTWSGKPNDMEQKALSKPGNFPRRAVQGGPRPHLRATGNFIEWDKDNTENQKHEKQTARKFRPNDPMSSSGNIISWHKDASNTPAEQPHYRPKSQGHNKMYGGSVPFGTDGDQMNPNFQTVGQTSRHSRKAGTNLRYASQSGQWWVPPPQANSNMNAAKRATPFGTDADL